MRPCSVNLSQKINKLREFSTAKIAIDTLSKISNVDDQHHSITSAYIHDTYLAKVKGMYL